MFSFKCDINVILEIFALEEQFISLANVLSHLSFRIRQNLFTFILKTNALIMTCGMVNVVFMFSQISTALSER